METAVVLAVGFALDLCCGDPLWLPHPVTAIGGAVAFLEKILRGLFPKNRAGELAGGAVLAVLVPAASFGAVWGVLRLAGMAHPAARPVVEGWLCYQMLATKSLRDAALAVHRELARGDLAAARTAVGRIVGRDTAALDAAAVTRATVETVAENASDGVVAPLLYFAVGGAPLAMAYKAVNTMDSMLGYKNDRYLHFGRAAARLDDVANFVPARLTAWLLVLAAGMCGCDWRGAARVYRRDRRNHASPNAGHPEAAAAGALGVRLGGASNYFGKVVDKPAIGDPSRPVEADDIVRANRLLYGAAVSALALGCGARLVWARLCEAGLWT